MSDVRRPMIWNHNRTCTKCRRSMPSAGAITYPKFICRDCRPKPPTDGGPAVKKAA